MDTANVVLLLLKAWFLTSNLMLVLWLVQAQKRNATFVDLGWTAGIGICAILYAVSIPGLLIRKVLLLMVVLLWCARLLTHLIHRLMKDPSEDRRYAKIREEWKTGQNIKFFFMFQFQGFLDVVLSWPFLLICLNPKMELAPVEIFGIIVSLGALVGESIADRQLSRFKSNASNKGKTCDIGLWYYSRHPNYFFEWLVWVGYFFMALNAPHGITAYIAPLLMIVFLLKVSGIPLAEAQSLKTKGEDYRKYQESTSMFVPWLKKK